jgi:hypothetical protein
MANYAAIYTPSSPKDTPGLDSHVPSINLLDLVVGYIELLFRTSADYKSTNSQSSQRGWLTSAGGYFGKGSRWVNRIARFTNECYTRRFSSFVLFCSSIYAQPLFGHASAGSMPNIAVSNKTLRGAKYLFVIQPLNSR